MILAVDPGNTESAYVVLDRDSLKPLAFDKVSNWDLLKLIEDNHFRAVTDFGIEMVASYGMRVGKDVFETCVWIGRFAESFEHHENIEAKFIYRKSDVCPNICHDSRANDADIRHGLIDRFAKHDFKAGKGRKKNPDWFFGFRADIWQAYAVGVTYHDRYLKGDHTQVS